MSGLSADAAARAIVAAAMLLGVDPAQAFEPGQAKGKGVGKAARSGRSVRLLAAHGVRARLGLAPVMLAKVFSLFPQELAPSFGKKSGFTTDHLLVIAEALEASETARAANARFLEPMSGVPVRPAPDARRPTPDARRPTPDARRPTPDARRPTPGVPAVTGAVKTPEAVRPQVVRYATWFLDARWSLTTVAALFEVEPEALLSAVEAGAEA
jgi:hypothetical protein